MSVTVTAYMAAMVIGTLTSRAALYHEGSIENGGAESVEPGIGGGKV